MTKRCLIVDDVEVSRFTGRMYLEELGYAVDEASDGAGARAMWSRNTYDVVLLDWNLKKRKSDGLLEELKTSSHGAGTRVIVFSGVEEGEAIAEIKRLGADGFLSKPTTKEKLVQQLNG